MQALFCNILSSKLIIVLGVWDTIITSDGRFPYSKSKIEIFSQNGKKSKSRFYNKLVHRFLLTWNTFIFDRDKVATFW